MAKKPAKRQKSDGGAARGKKRFNHGPKQETGSRKGRGRSDAAEIDDPEDLPMGKRTYSDVYVVGKTTKIDLVGEIGGKRRAEAVRDAEETLKSPRLFGSKEFINLYQKAHDAVSTDKDGEPATGPAKKKKSPRSDRSESPLPGRGKNANVGSEPGSRGKAVGLRIIGGRYRGIRLKYGGDHRVRPMKDRVRESVFNLMGTLARGRHVIDLFAGTGALAFEALSRGSSSAAMIEVHFPTARIIRENIGILRQKDPEVADSIELITTDVFFWGRNIVEQMKNGQENSRVLPRDVPWLVFCSPPYDFYVTRQKELLDLLTALRQLAPKDSAFVIESDERFDFDLLEADIPPKKRRSYPPAEVAVFTV